MLRPLPPIGWNENMPVPVLPLNCRNVLHRISGEHELTTTPESPLANRVTCFLALYEKFFVAHNWLARMIEIAVPDIGLIVRHPNHQACGLDRPLRHSRRGRP